MEKTNNTHPEERGPFSQANTWTSTVLLNRELNFYVPLRSIRFPSQGWFCTYVHLCDMHTHSFRLCDFWDKLNGILLAPTRTLTHIITALFKDRLKDTEALMRGLCYELQLPPPPFSNGKCLREQQSVMLRADWSDEPWLWQMSKNLKLAAPLEQCVDACHWGELANMTGAEIAICFSEHLCQTELTCPKLDAIPQKRLIATEVYAETGNVMTPTDRYDLE